MKMQVCSRAVGAFQERLYCRIFAGMPSERYRFLPDCEKRVEGNPTRLNNLTKQLASGKKISIFSIFQITERKINSGLGRGKKFLTGTGHKYKLLSQFPQ